MNLRLCPSCHQLFPPGTTLCPEHGALLTDDPLLGESVCGYQVVACLAEGLYTAVQPGPGNDGQVAVRLLPRTISESHTLQQLLGALRKASAKTEGVAVLPIDGGLLRDGRLFYLFPWTRQSGSEPLNSRLQTAPRPLEEALRIAGALCTALDVAHRAGYYHNGLRGETALLSARPGSGQFKAQLLDLGIHGRSDKADKGAAGRRDPTEDVYAVGALLYQLATGTPLAAATAFAGAGAQLPAEFQAVVLRALAQRREDRQQTIAALHKDLQALSRENLSVRRRPQRRSTWGVVLGGLTGVALVIALGASGLLLYEGRYPHRRPVLPPPAQTQPGQRPAAPEPSSPDRAQSAARAAWLVPLGQRAQALGVLREAARSADSADRLQAAEIIGHSRDRRLRLQGEDLLEDVDQVVAARAAWALGQLGDPAAAVALQQATAELRGVLEVGVALVQLGDRRGLDLLRGVLRGEGRPGEGETRIEAKSAGRARPPRGEGGGASAEPPLRVKKESDRLEAALWLGEHSEPEAWRVLRRLLTQAQDEDPMRHLTILGRLCRGRDQAACQQLRDRLTGKGGPRARGPARLLVGVGLMQAGESLGYDVLHEMGQEPGLRLRALRALSEAELLPDEERWLQGVVSGKEPAGPVGAQARAAAAEALGLSGALAALPVLAAAMGDEDVAVRRAAAAAVLRLSSLEPDLLLGRALDWAQAGISAGRSAVRAAAAATLGLGPPALAVPLLVQLLADRDAELRALAAQGLGNAQAQTPDGQRALAVALGDRDGAVRVAAVRALAQARELSAEVRQQLEGGSMLEQVAVTGVLLGRGERDGRAVLTQALQSPDVAVRRLAIEQARNEPDEARRAVLYGAAVADAADEVRLLAAVGLGRLGDRRGLDVLRGQAGMTLAQRLLARDALRRLKEAVPTLDVVAALGAAGEGQRAATMQVAPELEADTALMLVRRGLRDPAQAVRLQAVAAAARLPVEQRVREQLLLQVYHDLDPAVQGRALGLLAHSLEVDAYQ